MAEGPAFSWVPHHWDGVFIELDRSRSMGSGAHGHDFLEVRVVIVERNICCVGRDQFFQDLLIGGVREELFNDVFWGWCHDYE